MTQGKNHKRENVRGAPEPSSRDESSEGATVSKVYTETYSCDVRADSGKTLIGLPFPELIQDPEGCGGEVSVPRMGQRVQVSYGAGIRPRLTGFLPQSTDAGTANRATSSTTEFEIPASTAGRGRSNFRKDMPKDVLPGDWQRRGNQQQYLGVMDGGVIAIHGSPWANIRVIGGNTGDTLKITGRTTELNTDFGSVIFGSQEGKSWAEFYGGTDQSLEAGVDKQNWTVRGDIGKTDGLVNWYLTDRDGQSMHRVNIYPDGRTMSFQNGPQEEQVNGWYSGIFGEACSRQVQTGNDQLEVLNGDRIEKYFGNQKTNITQNRNVKIYSDDSTITEGNTYLQTKTWDIQAQGNLDATPGDNAISMAAINGSFNIDVAPTLSTALPSPQSGFYVTVGLVGAGIELITTNPATGDIKLDSKAGMELNSIMPMAFDTKAMLTQDALGPIFMSTKAAMTVDSVGPIAFNTPITMLSASSNVAIDPAVLYIELMVYLNTLAIALDTHMHFTTLPAIPTSPPIAPVFAVGLNAAAISFMSKKVFLGG
jgi:hypothetical protein